MLCQFSNSNKKSFGDGVSKSFKLCIYTSNIKLGFNTVTQS